MLNTFIAILLAVASVGSSQIPEYISIPKSTVESPHLFPGWRIEAPFPSLTEIEIELGDTIQGQMMTIGGARIQINEMRAQVRYETSITIMNEGPHLDMVNWKHYTSEWQNAERISSSSFKLPVFTVEQTSIFPNVTPAEIQEAVLALGGERWASLISDIQGPRDYPAGVNLSTIWVRIQTWQQEKWNTLTTIVVRPPMGC